MLWFLMLTSPLVLVIRQDRLEAAKGKLPAITIRGAQELLEDAGISRGTIHSDGRGRFHFSGGIPAELHQRLRNILVST